MSVDLVHDAAGRHSVLFRSLETARLAVVPPVRIAMGVPYTWVWMRIDRSGDRIRYESVRQWPRRGLRSRLTVRVGAEVEPTPPRGVADRAVGCPHP